MKSLILFAALFLSLTTMAAEKNPIANEKAVKTFNEVFKNAKNVYWTSTADYQQVSFESNAIKIKATFDNDGNLRQTIRYYKETNLPANIRFKLNRKFDKAEVWGVTELSNNEGVVYSIVLRSDKYFYNVKCDNHANIELVSKYNRGDR